MPFLNTKCPLPLDHLGSQGSFLIAFSGLARVPPMGSLGVDQGSHLLGSPGSGLNPGNAERQLEIIFFLINSRACAPIGPYCTPGIDWFKPTVREISQGGVLHDAVHNVKKAADLMKSVAGNVALPES